MAYRVFLSSPSDVGLERQAFRRVIDRLNLQMTPEHQFEAVLWEEQFYRADSSFQDQISPSASCDVVVCVLWNKIGVALPDHYARDDGTLPTGTEYEFETALARALNSEPRVPEIFMFRKTANLNLSQEELSKTADQYKLLELFWRKWFYNEQGQFAAAFNEFEAVSEFEQKVEEALKDWLKKRTDVQTWTQGSPYRGLARYEPDHARIFFGRKRDIDFARARLCTNASKGHRALFVVGASGSGKSSLVGAGLIPELERASGHAGLPLLVRRVITKPSELSQANPWAEALARRLFDEDALGTELAAGDCNTWQELARLIAAGGPGAELSVSAALRRLSLARSATHGLVLFVDQFEELLAWPKAEAEAFCSLLHALATQAEVFVVATIRSEFRHLLADFTAFRSIAETNDVASDSTPLPHLDLRPPTQSGLEAIIREPAELAGLTFEEGLLDRLEAVASPNALPALQFLLDQLYGMRDGQVLTHRAFDALGGIDGVMARRGDDALRALPERSRKTFRPFARLLLGASGAQDTLLSRQVPHEILTQNAPMKALAEALRDTGLLVSDAGGFRLAHEALIHGWPALQDVVAKERQNFSQLNYLSAIAKRYSDAGGSSTRAGRQLLLKKLPLREARALQREWDDGALAAGHPALPAFIRRSVNAAWRRGALGVGCAVALSAMVGVTGFWLQGLSMDALLQDGYAALDAQDNRAALDIASSLLARRQNSDSLSFAAAVLLDLQSGHYAGSLPDAVSAISPRRTTTGIVTLSPDGRLSLLPDGTQFLVSGLDRASINAIAHLPDDTALILTSATRIGRLALPSDEAINSTSPETIAPDWLEVSEAPLVRRSQWDFYIGPEFARLALADGDPEAGLTLTCIYQEPCSDSRDLPSSANAVAFDDDGSHLYWSTPNTPLGHFSFDAANPAGGGIFENAIENPTTLQVSALAPMLDDRILAGIGTGALMRFNAEAQDLAEIFRRPAQVATEAAPIVEHAASEQMAFRCGAQVLCVGAQDGPFSLVYPVPAGLKDIVWSLDGTQFWTVSYRHTADIWRAQTYSPFGLPLSLGAEVMSIDVSQDGAFLGVGLRSGAVFVLDRTGAVVTQAELESASVTRLRFATDGSLGVASEDGEIVMLRRDEPIRRCQSGIPIDDLLWVQQGEDAQIIGLTVQGYVLARRSAEADLICDYQSLLPARDPRGIGGGTPLSDGTFVVTRSDGALLRVELTLTASNGVADVESSAPAETVVPVALSADTAASRSVDVSSSGRWLAVARTSPELRVFDLSSPDRAPMNTILPGENTQTVAFSPDGRRLAALGAEGWLAVYSLSDAGWPELIAQLDTPVPHTLRHGGDARDATWIDWLSEDDLAIGTVSGDIVLISVEAQTIGRRLEDLSALFAVADP
ncbi:MAG: NACHT and WD repeat domain-containing protein [Pseudomonadota bacterium]